MGDVYDAASESERNQLNEALQHATQTLDESTSQAEVNQSEKELETAFWTFGENNYGSASNSEPKITDSKAETVKQDEKKIIPESELTQSISQLSKVKEISKPKVEKEALNDKMKIQKKQVISEGKVNSKLHLTFKFSRIADYAYSNGRLKENNKTKIQACYCLSFYFGTLLNGRFIKK